MSQAKTYRLGNQSEEYELSEKYLGWIPKFMKSLDMFHCEHAPGGEYPKSITLASPTGDKRTLNLHQRLIKDAFPLEFFGEPRATEWNNFLMVSEQDAPEQKFIIPMH